MLERFLRFVWQMSLFAAVTALLVAAIPCVGLGAGSQNAVVESERCQTTMLPAVIRDELRTKFGSWKIQEPGNLAKAAREGWQGHKPVGCPGIVVGSFQPAAVPAYAVLLVPVITSERGYRLLVFTTARGKKRYVATMLEASDVDVPTDVYVSKEPTSAWSRIGKKTYRPESKEALLITVSGDSAYGRDAYFWSKGHFSHAPGVD